MVYDYGNGGLWAYVRARDPQAILGLYPELEIIDQIPAWMTPADLAHYRERVLDVDEPPRGLLKTVIDVRQTPSG